MKTADKLHKNIDDFLQKVLVKLAIPITIVSLLKVYEMALSYDTERTNIKRRKQDPRI